MKIFVPTSAHPSKNSTLNKIVRNIVKNLKTFDSVYCIWFLYQPERLKTSKDSDEIIVDIHDYENAVQVLQDVKPDCVITNNNKHATIDFAFSLAAKFLNIPLIYCKIVDFTDLENSKKLTQIKDNFKRNIRKFVLKDPSTNQLHGSFIMFKNKFLFETKKKVEQNTIGSIKSQLGSQIFHFIGNNPENRFSDLADLNLVNNKMWFDVFKKCGISDEKMVVTGNPYWDEYFQIIRQSDRSKEPIQRKPIKILILTTPLVEHGHWTKKQRDEIISNFMKTLSGEQEFSFSFKIHPTSENIDTYRNYIKKINVESEIYQNELFWDIIGNFDVVLSYGFSMIHTEIALLGCRMILFRFKQDDFREMPLVDSAINSGFIQKCNKFDELPLLIKKLSERKIEFNQNYNDEVEKYFYKFDGNSGMRVAKAIHKFLKKS